MATTASRPQIGFGLGHELFRKVHTRRGTKKTRTGCFCCKKRRVKCDETRPNCVRCIQFGIKCDGYPTPPKKIINPKILAIPSTAIVKRPHYTDLLVTSHTRTKMLLTPSSTLRFADETEERFFRTFQNETAAELEGWFDSSFWHRLILQACVEEPFTQKVVTAVAAMSTSKKLLRNAGADTSHRAIVAQQTEFAFKQYQKALQQMRTALERAGDSRKALIGCILVCCFESLVGNIASAHAHAISGQKLLEQWLAQHPYKNQLEVGIASPADHLIEDDIIQAANFFNCQVSAYLDPRSASEHGRLRHEGDETMAHMPQKFKNMRDAHRYAMLMFRRIVHSIREISELAGDGRLTTSSDFQILEDGLSGLSLSPGESQSPESQNSQVADPLAFAAQQGECSLELARWRAAFSDLYEEILRGTNARDQAAAKSLIALTKAFDITIEVSLDEGNCSCDHLTPVFQEMLDLERDVIAYRKAKNPTWQYSFDLIVNCVLYTIARFCRERLIRREAIELMRMFGTREGYHDEQYFAALATKAMELEEEGVETDYIPESARIRQLDEIIHADQRWSKFHYLRGSDETVRVAEFRW